ncbi:MAG: VTT domain-containing protein [Candidatus Diapherotrites archaeon]|nr:VTT domain-containing protein [Candidatus Diapherotrites archaeon]
MVKWPAKNSEEVVKEEGNFFVNAFIIILAVVLIIFVGFVAVKNVDVYAIFLGLKEYGLAGFFVGSVIANSTIFVVVPIEVAVFAFGGVYNPIVLGTVVGVGAAIGELVSYIIGLGGSKILRTLKYIDEKKLENINSMIKKHGFVFIVLASSIPFPFDLVGIAAGILRYNIVKFFLGAAIGKSIRNSVIAFAGLVGLEFVKTFLMSF